MATHIDLSDLNSALPGAEATAPPPVTRQNATVVSCAISHQQDKTIFDFTFPNKTEGMCVEVPGLLDAQQCSTVVDLFVRECVAGRSTLMYACPE